MFVCTVSASVSCQCSGLTGKSSLSQRRTVASGKLVKQGVLRWSKGFPGSLAKADDYRPGNIENMPGMCGTLASWLPPFYLWGSGVPSEAPLAAIGPALELPEVEGEAGPPLAIISIININDYCLMHSQTLWNVLGVSAGKVSRLQKRSLKATNR